MPSSADTLAKLLAEEKRLHGRHKPENLFRQAKKIVQRNATEVMVKMTGAKKGAEHLQKHLSYNTRNGSVAAENQNGDLIDGEEGVKELVAAWTHEVAEDALKNRRTALAFVFSMPSGTDVEGLKDAVRQTAKERFAGHDYFMVLHDEHVDHDGHSNPNPHVHLTVNAKGFDGKQLHLSKEATRQLRETFADRLDDQGIEAQATSRFVRGVTKKGLDSSIHHMAARGAGSLTDKIKEEMAQMLSNLEQGKALLTDRDQSAIERQKEIRKDWLTLASQLMKEDQTAHCDFSRDILHFVKAMPPIETQRQSMIKKVQSATQKNSHSKQLSDADRDTQEDVKDNNKGYQTDR